MQWSSSNEKLGIAESRMLEHRENPQEVLLVKKAVIFDSSTIINLALNSMLGILHPLKESFGGNFLITSIVKKEIIDVPLSQKRFELEALQISNLIEKGVIEISSPPGLEKETENSLNIGNSIFEADGEEIKILHGGESSCFALAKLLKNDYDIILGIDERTARLLSEKPENLRKLFEKKLHTDVSADMSKVSYFSGFNIIRSSEILFVAYKKGLIELPANAETAIDALLFAARFKGCSISYEEIERAKVLAAKKQL